MPPESILGGLNQEQTQQILAELLNSQIQMLQHLQVLSAIRTPTAEIRVAVSAGTLGTLGTLQNLGGIGGFSANIEIPAFTNMNAVLGNINNIKIT
jgi:hypothetical protein